MEAVLPGPIERRIAGATVRALFYRGRRGPPRPTPPHLGFEAFRFAGNDGASLAGRWFEAANPRGTVVLAHPDKRAAQSWFLGAGIVEFLLESGLNVLTFDFAPYGESRGGSVYLHEDLVEAARMARWRAPRLPTHVFGVSLGAFMAANASPRLDGVDTLVLESPYPDFVSWYGDRPGASLARATHSIFRRSTPTFDARANLARAKARRILVVGSVADEVTPIRLTRAVAEAAPAERRTLLEVEEARHLGLFEASASYREALRGAFGTLETPRVPNRTVRAAAKVEA